MTGMEIAAFSSLAMSAASASKAGRDAKNQANYQRKIAQRNNALEKIKAARAENAMRKQAKSAAASARAKMGSAGIMSTDGSSQALLRGLRSQRDNQIGQINFDSKINMQENQMSADNHISKINAKKKSQQVNDLVDGASALNKLTFGNGATGQKINTILGVIKDY